jgi:TM2 domain-containing membrane protein YozV
MIRILVIFLLLPFDINSQPDHFNFYSTENRKKFADYLFCEGEYLRAVEEYLSFRDKIENDTVDFKIMICYSKLGLLDISNYSLQAIGDNSPFKWDAAHLWLKNRLLATGKGLNVFDDTVYPESVNVRRQKLLNASFLLNEVIDLEKEEFLSPFNNDERQTLSVLYKLKKNPPLKSPAIAGILSGVIPGSGKMYVGEWGDGLTALLVTGLFAFLAYDNFRAEHNTRAWIFTGLATLFYAGNIYGSIASAQLFNARINFEFEDGLKLFLERKNYFMPEYDFCN